jgi:EmrB/QacA subfamily drug resistance transporter
LALCVLMASLATSIANVGLPTLAQAFAASFQQVQWVVIAYLLAITALIVGAGRLGDIVGRRRLLIVGIGLFTAASLLCGAAPSLWLLIAARALQGVGAAIMMALAMALVGETVPKARTGAAMGLLGTMSAVGTTLGPSLGGVLIAGGGWRTIFLVNVPLGMLALALALRTLPTAPPAGRGEAPRFDALGTLLLAAALAAYALAMTWGRGGFGAVNLGLLAAAAVGAGLFILAQARAASPLLRLGMFRDHRLNAALLANAIVSTVLMATLVVGPFYLSGALRLGTAGVGLVMSAGPLVAALAGVPAGRVVDRFGALRMNLAGLAGIAAGLLGLALTPPIFGAAGYIAAMAVATGSYALFQAANSTAVMTEAGADQRGVVSAMLNLSRNLGLVTGASAMGAVFAWASGAADITAAAPQAVAAGMRTTFLAAAALAAGAWVVTLASRRGGDHKGIG